MLLLIGTNRQVIVVDDLFEGVLPSTHVVTNLKTGIPYYFRIKVMNPLGWSMYSNIAINTPSQEPDSPSNLVVDYASHVDEIQTVTTAATHIDEINGTNGSSPLMRYKL